MEKAPGRRTKRWASGGRRTIAGAILISLICLGTTFLSFGLEPKKNIIQYKLDHWPATYGLSQKKIKAIIQTRDGFLWLGTRVGLVRFDGIRFKIINSDYTGKLLHEPILDICEDMSGNLWFSSSDKVTCLKEGTFEIFPASRYPNLSNVRRIIEDQKGRLWFGTAAYGITCYYKGAFFSYTTADGLASNNVYDIKEDSNGNIWIATHHGLTKLLPSGRFTHIPIGDGTTPVYTYSFCERQNGEIWLGGYKVAYRLKDGAWTVFGKKDGLPDLVIVSLIEDKDQNLWLGTENDGLFRYRGGKFEFLPTEHRLSDVMIYALCEDREGSLWIGTTESGLFRLKDTPFFNYNTYNGLSSDMVYCIHEEPHGNIWLGTDAGLNLFNREKRTVTLSITTKDGLISNHVYSILSSRDGSLWIGTQNGLQQMNGGKFTTFTVKEGLNSNIIYSLLEDKQGNIWVGTLKGLNRIYGSQVISFPEKDGPGTKHVRAILESCKEGYWIGTADGLYRFKNGIFKHYTSKEGLADNYIFDLHEDSNGTLYIGTRYGGLSRFENGKFTTYNAGNGLMNRVLLIVEDLYENLWLGEDVGLFCVKKRVLDEIAAGKTNLIHPLFLTVSDGLKSGDFIQGIKIKDGSLWFGTFKGIAVIDSQMLHRNPLPPPVIIEEFKINGVASNIQHKQNKSSAPYILPPGKKRLEIDFTAPSFINTRKIKFKIKLDGYDDHWLNVNGKRSTIYTSLPAGNYTFCVKACNSDGVWNRHGATLSFTVQPHWYETNWFLIIAVIIILLAVFTGYRLRVRQLLFRETMLSKLVKERTRELKERSRQLEDAHRNIMDSIDYAQVIQRALLPPVRRMQVLLEDYFVFFKPRDVVSGDFYWYSRRGDCFCIAAVDCTGHGVPGALLSMVGKMKLNETAAKSFITNTSELLSRLHSEVRSALHKGKHETHTNDGMDVAICMVDLKQGRVYFSGARRPLYYVKDGKLAEIKGNRRTIGETRKKRPAPFKKHIIRFESEITLYLTSDGFADQDNDKGKKYGSRRLKEFLQAISGRGMARQEQLLEQELKNHLGHREQRDDITIFGVRLRKKCPERERSTEVLSQYHEL